MPLTRTNSPLGKLIIRNLGDVGGPRSDLVDAELDNVISWAKLSPRITFVDTADHGNSGGSLTQIISTSIPANTLAATGDFLEYVACMSLANNANNKTVVFRFDSQAPTAADWANTLAGIDLVFTVRIYRTSATTCRCYTSATQPATGGTDSFTSFADITVANMTSNALNFVVSLQATANNDIVHRVSHMATVSRS